MRNTLILPLLLLTSSILAQSVVPQALNETLNLAPRMSQGNVQTFTTRIQVNFLDDKGNLDFYRQHQIDFTQICLANTPESGLKYEVTIDSFVLSSKGRIDSPPAGNSVVYPLMGYHFNSLFSAKIPVVGKCYDLGIPLTKDFNYEEGYEFVDFFMWTRIAEQLRYTAGRRLSKVGDTATVAWPKPICYSIKNVINGSNLDQKPFKLTVAGLTSYFGQPCAVISIISEASPYQVQIYSTDSTSFVADGTSQINGEYRVSLNKGEIIYQKWVRRVDTSIDRPDGTTRDNHTVTMIEVTPRI